MLHDFCVAIVYWLERIFEICNHIHENIFPVHNIKNNVQTAYKLLIS